LRGVRSKVGGLAVDSQGHDSPPSREDRSIIVRSRRLSSAARMRNVAVAQGVRSEGPCARGRGPASSLWRGPA